VGYTSIDLKKMTADQVRAKHAPQQGQEPQRHLNEAMGLKEFIFRESQLSGDLQVSVNTIDF
jgi:hypothetical protein